METVGHKGYEEVGYHREGVTYKFTSELVRKTIEDKNMRLKSNEDLKR